MPEPAGFSLEGRVIVQFGGTGLVGRALVASLAAAQATLIVASRQRPALEELAARARAVGRGRGSGS